MAAYLCQWDDTSSTGCSRHISQARWVASDVCDGAAGRTCGLECSICPNSSGIDKSAWSLMKHCFTVRRAGRAAISLGCVALIATFVAMSAILKSWTPTATPRVAISPPSLPRPGHQCSIGHETSSRSAGRSTVRLWASSTPTAAHNSTGASY